MSPREPRSDEVRPIPHTGRPPEADSEGADVYVVDTRKKFSLRDKRATEPRPAPAATPGQAAPPRPGPTPAEATRIEPRHPQGRPAERPATARLSGSTSGIGGAPGGGEPAYRELRAAGSAASGGMPPAGAPRRVSRRVRVRRVLLAVLALMLAWVGFLVWVPYHAWSGVQRVDNTPAQRAAGLSGRNYLLVGSDSRAGLTKAEADALGLDTEDAGQHTDTIMLVHLSERGQQPVVVSIPRDSYVNIPGKGQNKINAAYSLGGAKLLTNTVEQVTGIHVDGYLEVGFVGFAGIVDSIGGVEVCVPFAMKDDYSGLDVKEGCQPMDGKTSLAYVRSRHSDPRGDLGRAERQRQFLGAVMKKAVTPSTVLNPGRYTSVSDAVAKGLIVGDSTTLSDAWRVMQALRAIGNGEGLSLQVPVENPSYQTKVGSTVKWNDAQAKVLFTALKNDESVSAPAAR
ncbi:MAG: LCP family protein [Dermatophilaceae bacterium]